MKKQLLVLLLWFIPLFSVVDAQPLLYGMTGQGGANNAGVIFRYNVTTGNYVDLINFTGDSGLFPGFLPLGNLIKVSDGNLYGMTASGGKKGYGNFFKFNPVSFTYTDLGDFTGKTGSYTGNYPNGSLFQAKDGNLYGMTQYGGADSMGNIFKYDPVAQVYTDLADFTGNTGAYPGSYPFGSLMQAYDSNLYGMTAYGGANSVGVIFRYNPYTNIYTDLVDFSWNVGPYPGNGPQGNFIQGADSCLYGMTRQAMGTGNIFKYSIKLNTFTDLIEFNPFAGPYPGQDPLGSLLLGTSGNMYGMTEFGDSNHYGNIFSLNPVSNNFTDIIKFTAANPPYPGYYPMGSLIEASDGNIYGMTYYGSGNGNIFQYNPVSQAYADKVEFTGTSGLYPGFGPHADLLEDDTVVLTGTNQVNGESENVKVYPNPSNGVFTVESSVVSGKSSVEVYNVLGEKVYSNYSLSTNHYSLDLSAQPNGIYFYRVIANNGNILGEGKLVIQK